MSYEPLSDKADLAQELDSDTEAALDTDFRSDKDLDPGLDPGSDMEPTVTHRRLLPMVATFVIMAVGWVILSGKFDAFHLSLGAISCAIVAWFSSDLLFPSTEAAKFRIFWLRFLTYVPWLMWQIFKANLWVLYICFHPKMMDKIDPKIITFNSGLTTRIALVTFANSITLTPGTITVDVDMDGNFTVHALDPVSASGLPGEMERRIANVFGD